MRKLNISVWVASIGVAALILASGCSNVSDEEIVGTYAVEYDFVTVTLEIRADGQFRQMATFKEREHVDSSSGTWSFEIEEQYIDFSEGYMAVIDAFGKPVPNYMQASITHGAVLPVKKVLGHVEIGGDDLPWGREGIDSPYKKVKPK